MTGRRATAGILLLCALVSCAFSAQSASASKAVNTTAVTCVKGGGEEDFADAHCDEQVGVGEGEFGHVEISPGTKVVFTVDNQTTGEATDPAVLLGKAYGAATEITCTKVHGEGTLENIEHKEAKQHTVTGTVVVKYTGCSVQKPGKCDVIEPLEVRATFEGVEGLGAEKDGMGVEFAPDESKVFTEITYDDNGAEQCALDGKSINLEGSAVATGIPAAGEEHSGTTPDFDHAKNTALGTLVTSVAGSAKVAAGFESTGTVRAKGGNPISLTTTTPPRPDIVPAGDDILATSTSVSFSVGSASVTCTLGQFWGTIASPATSSMSIDAPLFQDSDGTECSTGGGSSGVETNSTWTLNTISTTEASLTLSQSKDLVITPEPNCQVYNSGEAIVTGSWTVGTAKSPVALPSQFALSKVTIPAKAEGAGCSEETKEATSMTLSASFIVNDVTKRSSVVDFQ